MDTLHMRKMILRVSHVQRHFFAPTLSSLIYFCKEDAFFCVFYFFLLIRPESVDG